MYNASDTLAQMLHSIVGQSYKDWRLILIDDVSTGDHALKQRETIKRFLDLDESLDERIDVVWNTEKRWEVANVLHGISMCEDDDIVCRIDADDWLVDLDALTYLNAIYNTTGVDCLWTAHRWAFTDKNISGPLPMGEDPYKHPWVSSHLKTFRKRLLNGVNDANYRGESGNYIRRAGDQAIYLPCLHNSQRRGFVPRVFYHYTIKDEPATYQTDDARFQRDEALFLRARGYVR